MIITVELGLFRLAISSPDNKCVCARLCTRVRVCIQPCVCALTQPIPDRASRQQYRVIIDLIFWYVLPGDVQNGLSHAALFTLCRQLTRYCIAIFTDVIRQWGTNNPMAAFSDRRRPICRNRGHFLKRRYFARRCWSMNSTKPTLQPCVVELVFQRREEAWWVPVLSRSWHRWPSWGSPLEIMVVQQVACHPMAAGRELKRPLCKLVATWGDTGVRGGNSWLRGGLPMRDS